MEEKLVRINWTRGSYSDVIRSTVIDPSPLKQGQKVKVIWGTAKKELSAVVGCYPIDEGEETQESPEDPPPRRARTKRKLISDSLPAAKKTTRPKTKGKQAKQKPNKEKSKPKETPKAKPKGKILDTASPEKETDVVSSSDSSDSEYEGPLASLVPVRPKRSPPVQEKQTEPADAYTLQDWSGSEVSNVEQDDMADFHDLLSKAISTVDNTALQINKNGKRAAADELRLMRTMLERLECAFARQEAKMDKLLNMMTAAPPSLLRTPQCPPPPSVQSTPLAYNSSLEFPPPAAVPRSLAINDPPAPRTPLQEIDGLLENTQAAGNETVALGGYGQVRMSKTDFNFAKAAHKPTAMTLRLVDTLFTKEVLLRSTVHGTKDFAPLDPDIIAAIKAEVLDVFSYQCRSVEERQRMWEQCKVSIGKRCQNLRKDKPNRAI
ncbi:uncharacterized protein LOC144660891 [Oculina patagonica]